jgi:hypothetical protein
MPTPCRNSQDRRSGSDPSVALRNETLAESGPSRVILRTISPQDELDRADGAAISIN